MSTTKAVDQVRPGINWIAVVAMIFLCGMISFVTNLAAPVGDVWRYLLPEGSNTLGKLGNFMNFFAYLFMGVPSGMLLSKIGYKKTALVAVATGFTGVLIQYLSGVFDVAATTGFVIYLSGAFVAGLSMCLLNVVTNPMLNTLGGGGKRGNQLNLVGMTFNSVTGTLTPFLVGSCIGEIAKLKSIAQVNPVLFIALGVFAATFVVLSFLKIEDPEGVRATERIPVLSPLKFRHTFFGVVGIFCYVGVEVGIPATIISWLTAATGDLKYATGVASTYWLMMVIGRAVGSAVGGRVSSRQMMMATGAAGVVLVLAGILTGSPWCFVACGLCTSVMFPCTFNLAVEGLGKYTNAASGLFMAMIVGGGLLPLAQGFIADKAGFMPAFVVSAAGLAYLFSYAAFLSKPSKTPVCD